MMPRYTLLELPAPRTRPPNGQSATYRHVHSLSEIGLNRGMFKARRDRRWRLPPALQDSGRRGRDALLALSVHIERLGSSFDDFAIDDDLFDPVERGQVVHRIEQ